jgi:hypothetical protein
MLDLASIREFANQAIPLWSEAHNGPSDRCFTEPPVRSSYAIASIRQQQFFRAEKQQLSTKYAACSGSDSIGPTLVLVLLFAKQFRHR